MKFITKQIHAFLDYPVALALMGLPFLLGLGSSNPLALQLSVATGIAAFILTLLTDHQLGVFRVISYKIHLLVDFIVGLTFVLAPFIFSFEGLASSSACLGGREKSNIKPNEGANRVRAKFGEVYFEVLVEIWKDEIGSWKADPGAALSVLALIRHRLFFYKANGSYLLKLTYIAKYNIAV